VLLKVLSVNIGDPNPIAAKSGLTGFFKIPQNKAVYITTLGLAGDTIIDTQNHGGVDQAVYVYCKGDYDWWHAQQGLAVSPGLFGENLTIKGMTTADAHVGARLIGENVTLEITSPRTPCDTFAARMNDKTFPKRFWKSMRTGFYCRVIKEGAIGPEEQLQLQPFDGVKISIDEWIASGPLEKLDDAARARFLSAPVHYKAREVMLRSLKLT
jgi:MOSC domain-containing protein YiiM